MPDRRRPSLRLQLVAAFVLVAAVAVAASTGLTLWGGRENVADLVGRQQAAAVARTSAAVADAYRAGGGWAGADLRPARALAVSAGAILEVRDADGATVAAAGRGPGAGPGAGFGVAAHATGPARSAVVVVGGRTVGGITLHFLTRSLPPAERQLRDALSRTSLIGAAIAVAVAVAVATGVAVGITRPLRRLTQAVERLGRGDRSARANLAAPGELGVLALEFDAMASRLEREDELRRALTADVAHELRTPVSILRAHCEAIVDGVEEPSPSLLGSLYDEVLRLGNLIEDVETLSSAEAAGLRLVERPVDLAEVVRETVALLAPHADAAEVHVGTQLPRSAVVSGDPRRLAQIVRNLVVNALKFTPPGGTVDVAVEHEPDRVILRVSDTGRGISEEELPHVFERFWRGRAAGGADGSGIGLAVVSELVRAHGGTVDVASAAGAGSTFSVSLPAGRG